MAKRERTTSGTIEAVENVLTEIQKRKKKGYIEDIRVYSPRDARGSSKPRIYWEFYRQVNGETKKANGGKTVESGAIAFFKFKEKTDKAIENSTLGLSRTQTKVSTALQEYLDNDGPNGDWSENNAKQQKNRLNYWLENKPRLRCEALTKSDVEDYLKTTTSKSSRNSKYSVFRTFVRWGTNRDFFTPMQMMMVETVNPKGVGKTKKTKSRKESLQEAGQNQVLNFEQVNEFGAALNQRYKHGELLIQLLAFTGLRIGEALTLRYFFEMPEVLPDGNFVTVSKDLSVCELNIRQQVDGNSPSVHKPPKKNQVRTVIVPPDEAVLTGYPLRQRLLERCGLVQWETIRSTNPNGLLFPTEPFPDKIFRTIEDGFLRETENELTEREQEIEAKTVKKIWTQSNLTNRIVNPVIDELGWRLTPENEKAIRGYTLHSLRDRFATTAVDHWKYTPGELRDQGGWKNVETVYRNYYETNDNTHSSVKDKLDTYSSNEI